MKTLKVTKLFSAILIASSSSAIGANYTVGGGTVDSICANAIAIGQNASGKCDSTNLNSIAIGNNAYSGGSGVALGDGADSFYGTISSQSVAIGLNSKAKSLNSLAAGATSVASGNYSTALGSGSIASGTNSVALGQAANASAVNSMALGTSSRSTLANSVALGSNSIASAVSATTSNTVANSFISGKTLLITQAPTNGVVAIGNRQIQGVSDGQLSSTSTDAVNGSQLFQVTSGLNGNTNALGTSAASALGGGAAYNSATGVWTAPSYSIQGTSYNNVGSALGGVDSSLTALNNSVTSGSIGVVQRTSTPNIATLTAAGGTASAPGAAQKLTNLDAGTLSGSSTDAVNGSQLFATNTNVGTNTTNLANLGTSAASALGGGAAYNSATGVWTAPSYSIQGTSYNNVGSALGGVDSSLTALNNSVTSGSIGVVQRTSTPNIATLTAAGGTASAPGAAQKLTNLAKGNLAADSTDAVNGSQLYTVADQVYKNTTDIAGLTTIVNNATESNLVKENGDDNSITIGVSKGGRSVSVAGTEGDRTLSGVGDGVAANDAATVGQLQGVVGNISSRDDTGLGVAIATGTNGLAVGAGSAASGNFSSASGAGAQAMGANSSASGSGAKATADNSSAFGQGATASGESTLAAGQGSSSTSSQAVALGADSHASGTRSVALGYGSVADRDNSVSVGSVGHERQITNVASGTDRTDAANVGQVNDAFQSLGKSVNKKINDLDDKLTGGIASAMAMSGIPQAYQPNSSLVGASASTYNGQSAISVGVSKISEDGKWIFKVSGSGNTQSDFGASVGVGYQW